MYKLDKSRCKITLHENENLWSFAERTVKIPAVPAAVLELIQRYDLEDAYITIRYASEFVPESKEDL